MLTIQYFPPFPWGGSPPIFLAYPCFFPAPPVSILIERILPTLYIYGRRMAVNY